MKTENTEQAAEQPVVNQRVLKEIEALGQEVEAEQTEAKAEQQAAQQAETLSAIQVWEGVIKEVCPYLTMIHPELNLNRDRNLGTDESPEYVNELDYFAAGVAPALAKRWPDMQSVSIPVELVAIYVTHQVFTPKIKAIKADLDARKKLKEVNNDATPESQ